MLGSQRREAIGAPSGEAPLLEDEAVLLLGRSALPDSLRRLHSAFRGRQVDIRQPRAGRTAVPHGCRVPTKAGRRCSEQLNLQTCANMVESTRTLPRSLLHLASHPASHHTKKRHTEFHSRALPCQVASRGGLRPLQLRSGRGERSGEWVNGAAAPDAERCRRRRRRSSGRRPAYTTLPPCSPRSSRSCAERGASSSPDEDPRSGPSMRGAPCNS